MVYSRRTSVLTTLTLCCALFAWSKPAAAAVPAASAVVNGAYVLGLNIPSSNDNDLFFHLEAPQAYSWVGFGIGNEMKDSLMFVAYRSADGQNVTVSPRAPADHMMPKLNSSISVEVLDGTKVDGTQYFINAKCSNCRSWSGGALNIKDTQQSMLYALGPYQQVLKSDQQDAAILQHEIFGMYDLDVTAGVGQAGVPTNVTDNPTTIIFTNENGTQGTRIRTIHGLVMLFAFVVLFPTGTFIKRFLGNVRVHWIVQTAASTLVVLGLIWGLVASIKYDMNPSLRSGHQILGIIVTGFVLIQLGLGVYHHLRFKKTGLSSVYGKIHRFFGPLTILLGLVNGGSGLYWVHGTIVTVIYSVGLFVGVVGLVGLVYLKRWRDNRRRRAVSQVKTEAQIALEQYPAYPAQPYPQPPPQAYPQPPSQTYPQPPQAYPQFQYQQK